MLLNAPNHTASVVLSMSNRAELKNSMKKKLETTLIKRVWNSHPNELFFFFVFTILFSHSFLFYVSLTFLKLFMFNSMKNEKDIFIFNKKKMKRKAKFTAQNGNALVLFGFHSTIFFANFYIPSQKKKKIPFFLQLKSKEI